MYMQSKTWLPLSLLMIYVLIQLVPSYAAEKVQFDYNTALKDAIYFYDGNKCGKDVARENVFKWRRACHVTDGSDVKLDLSGGFHDAGDHVKFGLTQGYTASILGWSLYEYKDIFMVTGLTPKLLSTLKYFTDYFLKSHPKNELFYYQVGNGVADHSDWFSPEYQLGDRPTLYYVDPKHPASDVCGVTAAALALMYLNSKVVDPVYAERCLKAAKELYAMGKKYPGLSRGQTFYQSGSYRDDLAWGAFWLYQIEHNNIYLTDIQNYLTQTGTSGTNPFRDQWTMSWDDLYLPVMLKMAEQTGEAKYHHALSYNLNYWKKELKTTPGGLKYRDQWGVLRYAAAESFLALLYYRDTKDDSLKVFARSQLDYILGNNPAKLPILWVLAVTIPRIFITERSKVIKHIKIIKTTPP